MLTDLASTPGGYYSCGASTVVYKPTGNYYLLKHANLRWVRTDATGMMTVPNTLSVTSGTDKFLFGRVVISTFFTTVTYTGKVKTGANGKKIEV